MSIESAAILLAHRYSHSRASTCWRLLFFNHICESVCSQGGSLLMMQLVSHRGPYDMDT